MFIFKRNFPFNQRCLPSSRSGKLHREGGPALAYAAEGGHKTGHFAMKQVWAFTPPVPARESM
ncbi:MAG: hypothetical protein LBD48_00185, partial [Treponema sp.]|nr:hypothetical protein [Treponema sp.]